MVTKHLKIKRPWHHHNGKNPRRDPMGGRLSVATEPPKPIKEPRAAASRKSDKKKDPKDFECLKQTRNHGTKGIRVKELKE